MRSFPPPLGWPGTLGQWQAQLGRLESEYRALVFELRARGHEIAKGDRARQEDYIRRRVGELCRWNGWGSRS